MTVAAIVQARMGSSRLPGKALLSLGGAPMLQRVLARVRRTAGVHQFVLATSYLDADTPLARMAGADGWSLHRGSERDVLARTRDAAAAVDADVVLRVTADCPFWDPAVGAAVLELFLAHQGATDYASNDTTCSGYPDGLDAEVFSRAALELAAAQATEAADREHVTRWVRRELRALTLRSDTDYSALKLSVDRPEDYAFARRVWACHPCPESDTSLAATLDACRRAAEVC